MYGSKQIRSSNSHETTNGLLVTRAAARYGRVQQKHRGSILDGPGRREAAGHPCAGSAEPEASWAVPRFFRITRRLPIAVVVVLTGKHFGFVMLAFLVSAFAVETIGEASFAGDASFATGEASFAGDAFFAAGKCRCISTLTFGAITGVGW